MLKTEHSLFNILAGSLVTGILKGLKIKENLEIRFWDHPWFMADNSENFPNDTSHIQDAT